MSKFKTFMSLVDDVKTERKQNPGLFSYVPDSIENHENNQKKNKNNSPGKGGRGGSNYKSLDGRHGNSDLNLNKKTMSKDRSPKRLTSFDDQGDVTPKAPKIRSGNTTPLATDSFSEGAASSHSVDIEVVKG